MSAVRVGLIGDRNDDITAHRAIPLALGLAADACGLDLEPVWLPTEQVGDGSTLTAFAGLWCVPGSPYRCMDGALSAIQIARERSIPFLGTCGGFQHAVIEYARNVLGWTDAEHAETAPQAKSQVIVPLLCSLIEVSETLQLVEGSLLAKAYDSDIAIEGYHCNYGVTADFRLALGSGALKVNALDANGDIRGIELRDHPFFVATLFQPERSALQGRLPPIVNAFIQAMIEVG